MFFTEAMQACGRSERVAETIHWYPVPERDGLPVYPRLQHPGLGTNTTGEVVWHRGPLCRHDSLRSDVRISCGCQFPGQRQAFVSKRNREWWSLVSSAVNLQFNVGNSSFWQAHAPIEFVYTMQAKMRAEDMDKKLVVSRVLIPESDLSVYRQVVNFHEAVLSMVACPWSTLLWFLSDWHVLKPTHGNPGGIHGLGHVCHQQTSLTHCE